MSLIDRWRSPGCRGRHLGDHELCVRRHARHADAVVLVPRPRCPPRGCRGRDRPGRRRPCPCMRADPSVPMHSVPATTLFFRSSWFEIDAGVDDPDLDVGAGGLAPALGRAHLGQSPLPVVARVAGRASRPGQHHEGQKGDDKDRDPPHHESSMVAEIWRRGTQRAQAPSVRSALQHREDVLDLGPLHPLVGAVGDGGVTRSEVGGRNAPSCEECHVCPSQFRPGGGPTGRPDRPATGARATAARAEAESISSNRSPASSAPTTSAPAARPRPRAVRARSGG